MSDVLGDLDCWFSHGEAHIYYSKGAFAEGKVYVSIIRLPRNVNTSG